MSAAPPQFGIGLRPHYYSSLLESEHAAHEIEWYEAVSENYMYSLGRPLDFLLRFRHEKPVALHGVSLSIGATDPLNTNYLEHLKKLVHRVEPLIVSDHLCWGTHEGKYLHDLLPLPYMEEVLSHVASRVHAVQEILDRQICFENVSSYVEFKDSEMPEWEFLQRLTTATGCGILLDINNVYVNSINHGFSAETFINSLKSESVKQFHLSGHTDKGTWLFDTHDASVVPPVWKLFQLASKRFPGTPLILERDDHFPPLENLVSELRQARTLAQGEAQ